MESFALTYWVLAFEADDREAHCQRTRFAWLLATAIFLPGSGAIASPLPTFEFEPDGDYSLAQDATVATFQLDTIVKLQKPEVRADAAPTTEQEEFAPSAGVGDRDPETSAVEVVPAAAAPIPPAWQEEFPTESTPVAQPPDFRQWVELRLEARARDRQAAAEAAAAPRSSYRYYPRPYYSRATIPDELKISPFNLVYRAYQGGFKDSEIPSYGALLTAYRSGKIAPEDLVRAGIVQGRLTAADLYDQSYLQAVKSQMENLD